MNNGRCCGHHQRRLAIRIVFVISFLTGSLSLLAQTFATLPYCTGFESGSLDASWTTTSTGVGQVLVVSTNSPFAGTFHMTMDVSVNNNLETNEAWLHLNLSGETQVELSVQFKDFSDENNTGANGDGIFFSDDSGSTFTEVFHINPTTFTNNTYSNIILDVDALASTFGLTLNATFVIKFQQRDNFGITNDGHAYDEISVTDPTTVTRYAIADGNWATTGTWSLTSGGASCCCVPSATSEVHIENTFDVTITSDVNAKDLTIESGGTLDINGGGDDLTINNGGTVTINSGGSFTGNAAAATERLKFATFAGTYTLIVNDATTGLDVGELWVDSDLTLNISGSGAITLQDDIEFRGDDASINNNLTNTLAMGPDVDANINFGFTLNVQRNTFTNNQTMTINAGVYIEGDNNEIINTGTITCSDDVQIGGATDDNNKITNSGTITYTVLDIGNADFIFDNTGTVNMSAAFTNTAGVEAINNKAGGTWNWSSLTTAPASLSLFCNFNANTFNYNGAGNQTLIQPADNYWNLTLSTSGTKSTSYTPVNIDGNLTISGTAVFDAGTGLDDITLAGNWNNSGTFTEGAQSVTLDGSSAQTITNASGESFNNLIINNTTAATAVTLNDPIAVNGALTLTDGTVLSTAANKLSMGSTATTSGFSDASFVDGPMTYNALTASTVTFPVGKDSEVHRVDLTVNGTSSNYTTEYIHSSAVALGNALPGTLDRVSDIGYWTISRDAGGTVTSAAADLYYNGNDVVSDAPNLRVAKDDGAGNWIDIGGTGTGFPSGNILSTTNFTAFSSFSLANNIGGANALPIELKFFHARASNNQVLLDWQTASESNNDFFTVERSKGALNWEDVIQIDGAGNSSIATTYSAIDNTPIPGISYYRLKQTDFDGQYSYSAIQIVDIDKINIAKIFIYPNPTNQQVTIKGDKSELETFAIFNVFGQNVISSVIMNTENETILVIDLSNLARGIYTLKTKSTANRIYKQ